MVKCSTCGEENGSGQDFCTGCGAYLRWELSVAVPVVPVEAPAPVPEPTPAPRGATAELPRADLPPEPRAESPGERVELTLRAEGATEAGAEPPKASVLPGSAAALVAEVDNRTSVVDHFHVTVSGLPEDWYTVAPGTVHLNPYGAPGDHRAEARILLHPPRSPRAEARVWPFEVAAISEDRQIEVAVADAELVVEPYEDFVAEVRPARRAGRRRARFDMSVRNRGNAPLDVHVAASDEEQSCRIDVEEPRMTAPPGAETTARIVVHAPKPIWCGRPVDRQLNVTAQPAGTDEEPVPHSAVFRQRPWLAWWMPIAAVIAFALLLLLLKLLPDTTEVPDLRGAKSPFAAQQRLTKAELKLAPNPERRVTRSAPPGSVIAQDPPAGEKADKGSVVTVVQAVGSGQRRVPSVVGSTLQEADQKLRDQDLVLGSAQPQPADPKAKIVAQIPAAKAGVANGTAVNVSLEPKAQPGEQDQPPKKEKGTGTPPGGADEPSPGQDGAAARLAYDDGKNVSLWDPATKTASPLTASGTASRPVIEPAWSADGAQLAYMRLDERRQGRIYVADIRAGESSARPVDEGDGDHHRPSISPSGDLLAYISEDGSNGGKVCVQANDGRPHAASCLDPGDWEFRGRAAWSPDGTSLLVIASARGNEELAGLFQYTTDVPGSARARDWRPAGDGLVLPLTKPNSVAWSPDGRQVAVMASPDGTRFSLFLVPAQSGGLTGVQRPVPDVTGCEAAWRPDGLLAVSVYDCGQPVAAAGQVELVDPKRPSEFTQLSGVHGRNPSWQPAPKG